MVGAYLPEIKQACAEGHTFFYASNFSLGVNVLFAVNSYLAKIMSDFPIIQLVRMKEIHHIHKLDAPSGTAITLAEGDGEHSLTHFVELGTEPKEEFFLLNRFVKVRCPVTMRCCMTAKLIRSLLRTTQNREKDLPLGL